MSDVAVYAQAEQIVANLSDEQCDAVMAALERRVDKWGLDHPRSRVIVPASPPVSPARRRPSLVEAIRGVECCDPAVRAQWRLWRIGFRFIAAIFVLTLAAGALFGSLGVSAVIATLCIVSMFASHSILGGKAGVCR